MKNLPWEYLNFYMIAGGFGRNPIMRECLANRWLRRFQEECTTENLKMQFWLLVDTYKDIFVAFNHLQKMGF
ncbi:hypothetical protein [Clostridium formicaceticum]|uniref:Uncharacterized protein n=1 Tax=Clostridium formicaceticum TaxID=1497 RepID=A0AAC9WG91_9CLOT|nr:hypothetical protein [Clostridium formicaceticum]AOY77078.1 hypothetical protein BJL90_15215 [Clostridium formicaceticum]ARE87586.1 hypothetical protein CLFO_19860 [Clostridium formicaceticum]